MTDERIVLLTAFEPFGGASVNASEQAALPLDGRVIAGHRVVVAVLPCVFGAAIDALGARIEDTRPALVIATGEAANRAVVSLERVAINVDDARIPDNAGQQPIDVPVDAGGAVAYWSTLPLKPIVAALRDAGVPAAISESAGTFVCNHVFYALMQRLAGADVRGGFVHVPVQATLPTAEVTRALEIVIATALGTQPKQRH